MSEVGPPVDAPPRRSDPDVNVTALRYVDVEVVQDWCSLVRNEYGEVIDMVADPDLFPNDTWADALDRVMADADSAICGLYDCESTVGWLLHDDDDDLHGRGLVWRWMTLIDVDGNIVTVCEDHAPTNLYAADTGGEQYGTGGR